MPSLVKEKSVTSNIVYLSHDDIKNNTIVVKPNTTYVAVDGNISDLVLQFDDLNCENEKIVFYHDDIPEDIIKQHSSMSQVYNRPQNALYISCKYCAIGIKSIFKNISVVCSCVKKAVYSCMVYVVRMYY